AITAFASLPCCDCRMMTVDRPSGALASGHVLVCLAKAVTPALPEWGPSDERPDSDRNGRAATTRRKRELSAASPQNWPDGLDIAARRWGCARVVPPSRRQRASCRTDTSRRDRGDTLAARCNRLGRVHRPLRGKPQ